MITIKGGQVGELFEIILRVGFVKWIREQDPVIMAVIGIPLIVLVIIGMISQGGKIKERENHARHARR